MTTDTTIDVLIVGLGTVAQTHIAVLTQMPQADVVAAVDIDASRELGFRGGSRPVYHTVREASRQHQPAAVVIATPTSTHAAVCDEVSDCFPAARLLVEKPAAAALADAEHVIVQLGKQQPVEVSYHLAFSPEVTWGLEQVQARARTLGRLTSAEQFFADAYYDDPGPAQASLCSSWIDSGINALSVLDRFTSIVARSGLRQIGPDRESCFEARLTCTDDGSPFGALLVTSWHVSDGAKTTRLTWTSGVELLMDHTAVAAYLVRNGTLLDEFGSDRSVPRRERHYRALYQHWLIERRPIMSPQESMHLHDLLLGPYPA